MLLETAWVDEVVFRMYTQNTTELITLCYTCSLCEVDVKIA